MLKTNMGDHVLDVELARERTAPWTARRAVERAFAHKLSEFECATARLLVSELVTNAVVHGHGRITLRARLSEDALLVDVIDEGTGFDVAVCERGLDARAISGRGLMIVDAEATRWGIGEGTTHVWFELERPSIPPGA